MIARPSVRRLRLPRRRTRSRYSPRQSHRRGRIRSGRQSNSSIRNTRRHKRARRITDRGNSSQKKWERAYIKRIDATIATLKSAGVPVIWVGLPSQRGTNASAESSYLNELYRSQAEKAGIVYVDIWDGFVDEDGKFSPQGPDHLGQTRRLRTSDGVYFTKFGARKLAHYVEREIEHSLSSQRVPVALPIPAEPEHPGRNGKAGGSVRPMAGPVVPLTGANVGSEQVLLGGPGESPGATVGLSTDDADGP